ncbi:hypothetical protein MLIT_27310 [Mycolicibacterium litorale]|uniref:Uncharacterized protein n=1 Tax=Mycolicibacterium litorale TaxID=758802 RepID=A0AAD1IKK2_9MYCO|nr:hypothetical protein MLIT_27310 [Mycolicibacterium litorale]
MDSNFEFGGVAVAGMWRTLRAVAPHSVAAHSAHAPAHASAGIPARIPAMPAAAIPAQRKRRAATAATRTSVERGLI